MKAITLHQPWASWIAFGWKKIETRSHNRLASLVGQRIAIHAGKTFDAGAAGEAGPYLSKGQREAHNIAEYPWGVVICTAYVVEARQLNGKDSPRALYRCGDGGTWGLVLRDVKMVWPHAEAAGHQGIWEWDPGGAAGEAATPQVIGESHRHETIEKGTAKDMATKKATKKAKKKTRKPRAEDQKSKAPDAPDGSMLVGSQLMRVYGEHEVVEEREKTLLDVLEACKQAKADLAAAVIELARLLVDADPDGGAYVINARIDVRQKASTFKKASKNVAEAKASLAAAWGAINELVDEKIDGLELFPDDDGDDDDDG